MEAAGELPPMPDKFARGPKGPRQSQNGAGASAGHRPTASPADGNDVPLLMNDDEEMDLGGSQKMGGSAPLEVDPTE